MQAFGSTHDYFPETIDFALKCATLYTLQKQKQLIDNIIILQKVIEDGDYNFSVGDVLFIM
jgi:hypothetical protein